MHNGSAVLIVRYGIITLFNALLFGAGHNSDNWTLQCILNDVKKKVTQRALYKSYFLQPTFHAFFKSSL